VTAHPAWCRTDRQSEIGRHVSAVVRVGQRRPGRIEDRGQVSAYLMSTGDGPARLAVNAAHMASATVDLSLEDARQLRDGLTWLLKQADG
jgi:hypothetical protein